MASWTAKELTRCIGALAAQLQNDSETPKAQRSGCGSSSLKIAILALLGLALLRLLTMPMLQYAGFWFRAMGRTRENLQTLIQTIRDML